ncbi:hypothetical protein LYNGBM3L_25390 [Moorena producens 3L]|uniref:Uncharacterized protein n=1 Tax=Moorena producens 3L TaxID=489825 RepID=F4XNV4_9CYAN|nr:hypothetical protein LYNGBM3L_25390 [Moorena producens 3L]OLT64271.1 hypothetical protein BI334_03825 [Moorena producens 3L]
MQNEPVKIEITVTPEFKRSLRNLAKQYRNIRSNFQPIIDQLQSGEIIGDQNPRIRGLISGASITALI